jgi:hypothetical protein
MANPLLSKAVNAVFSIFFSIFILKTPTGSLWNCLQATSHEWHPTQAFGSKEINLFTVNTS